jgi:NADH dehydrogenase
MVPDQGSTLLQPIWIEDLVKIMAWSLQMPQTRNEIIEIGGPEYLNFREICEMVAAKLSIHRCFINIKPVVMNRFTELLEILMPNFPTTVFWLDYLATNRTTDLGYVSDRFDLLPSRMSHKLDYLEGKRYNKLFWKIIFSRKRSVIKWD